MLGNSLLLDSCVVIRHFRDATAVADRLAAFEDLYLPQQALGELYYGAYRSAHPEKHLVQIQRLLAAVDVINPDEETSRFYGQIATALAQAGTPIPQNDVWIAAMAMQTGLPLATSDEHFERIPGLSVLKW